MRDEGTSRLIYLDFLVWNGSERWVNGKRGCAARLRRQPNKNPANSFVALINDPVLTYNWSFSQAMLLILVDLENFGFGDSAAVPDDLAFDGPPSLVAFVTGFGIDC